MAMESVYGHMSELTTVTLAVHVCLCIVFAYLANARPKSNLIPGMQPT